MSSQPHNEEGAQDAEHEASAAPELQQSAPTQCVGRLKGTGTLTSSTANLLNTLVGAGVISMPYAMKFTGLFPGMFLIVFCGFTSASGLYLLTRCAAKIGTRDTSFTRVAQKTFPKAAKLFDLIIGIKCFGTSISYILISSQLAPQIVISFFKAGGKDPHEIPSFILNRELWILLFMMVMTPLCFLRRLDSLRHTSYLSFVAVVYLVIIVIFYAVTDHAKQHLPPRGDVDLVRLDGHLISIFPVFVFAFTCAQNVFPVYNELSQNTEIRINTVIASSIGSAALVYELVAILGYLTFGSLIQSNLLALYPAQSFFVCGGRIAIVMLTAASYPMQIHPCRAAFDKVFQRSPAERIALGSDVGDEDTDVADSQALLGERRGEQVSSHQGSAQAQPDEISLKRWCILTCTLLTTTFIISLFIDDLSIVLGFVGSIGSTTVSFILPGLLYATLHRDEPGTKRLRRFAQGLALWGLVVLVFTFSANVLKVVRAPKGSLAPSHADQVASLLSAHAGTNSTL